MMARQRYRRRRLQRVGGMLAVLVHAIASAAAFVLPWSQHRVVRHQQLHRTTSWFVRPRHAFYHHHQRSDFTVQSTMASDKIIVNDIRQACRAIAAAMRHRTTDDIQRHLVQVGRNYLDAGTTSMYNQTGRVDCVRASAAVKVPGCVATVHVQTILSDPNNIFVANTTTIRIVGMADALLSRGLLAMVAHLLKDQCANDVLQLDPAALADQLGLRQALSVGRNDGVASMLRTIQQQVRDLLDNNVGNGGNGNASSAPNDNEPTAPLPIVPTGPSVALLLSGGVDSSVALRLLQQDGYNVTAFYLKIWLEDEVAHLGTCPWEDDYRVCRDVCAQAQVPLETISLQQAYQDRVISYTVHEARAGRTPNPDIMCNARIKFGVFYDAMARGRNFDFVATGHYARIVVSPANDGTAVRLLRAPDPVKDQSYFLCALTQEQLQRVKFPIGHLRKAEVRALAERFDLPNRHRPDSQGLCFLGKVKFDDFLANYLGERPGPVVNAATGELIGRHRGVWFHTVGQRKGIGNSLNPLATSQGPWYVVAKDVDRDIVYCSNQYDATIFAAARSQFAVENITWIGGGAAPFSHQARLHVKVRHGPKLVAATLTLLPDDDNAGETIGNIVLDSKDSGLAPGQYVAFYRHEECLGGGVISEKHWADFLRLEDANRCLQASLASQDIRSNASESVSVRA